LTSRRRGPGPVGCTVLLLALAGPLPAQVGGDPAGEWDAEWASAVRDDGNSLEVQRRSPALLLLERRGDTLSGTWAVEVIEAETWVVTGSFSNGVLRMEARATVDGSRPGDGVARLVLLEWTGRLSEDGAVLEGEQWLTLETPRGPRRSGPRPWTARRRE
jgi:hypothetical protein